MNPKIVLAIALAVGLIAIFNSFPPYDFILCILSGFAIGLSIRLINEKRNF